MKKISKTKIATTYANALYQAAFELKAVEKVRNDVLELSKVIKADADFIQYLGNPIVDELDKKDVLKQVSKKLKLSSETLNCLDVMVDNLRLNQLQIILDEFVHVCYSKNNIQEVLVESVKSLSSTQEQKLQLNLEKLINKKVVISYEIQPELIGGLRIKYASEMIDNSIASKLNHLENVMKGGQ